jgi:hypothetical protein
MVFVAALGHDDHMRGARRGLEHGKAAIETVGDINLKAGKGDADALVGWQTDVVHDELQAVAAP